LRQSPLRSCHVFQGKARLFDISQQNHNILYGGCNIFLNLHPPDSAPSRPLETVTRGAGKRALHKMLSGADICSGYGRLCAASHPVQILLPAVPFKGPAVFRCRALAHEMAACTGLGRAFVFESIPVGVIISSSQAWPAGHQ